MFKDLINFIRELYGTNEPISLHEPYFDEDEKIDYSAILFPRSKTQNDYAGNVFLSPRGGVGQFLRRTSTLPEYEERLSK